MAGSRPNTSPAGRTGFYYIILRLVDQSCGQKDGEEFDSWAISAFELAIEELDGAGYVEIDRNCGRIYATITPKGRSFTAWMRAWRDAEDAWAESETTPIPPGGPVNTMKHRHLVEGVGFTKTAIADILDRGQMREWVPLVQAIRADPYGMIAQDTLAMCDAFNDYAAPIFRRVIAKARKSP
jgi:hypothetical protein